MTSDNARMTGENEDHTYQIYRFTQFCHKHDEFDPTSQPCQRYTGMLARGTYSCSIVDRDGGPVGDVTLQSKVA